MSVAVATPVPGVGLRPLSREEYARLDDAGAFEGQRVQLLEGVLVDLGPMKVPHASTVEILTMRLVPPLVGRARVRCQLPIAAGPFSEPEPDFAIVALSDPKDRHPEVPLLVIEVADSSLRLDLTVKARIYAQAGVPEYWVIDVKVGRVLVHRDPQGDRYATRTEHGRGETLSACGAALLLDDELLPV